MPCINVAVILKLFLTYLTDNDDDGENAAGARLAHLLQILVTTSKRFGRYLVDIVHLSIRIWIM